MHIAFICNEYPPGPGGGVGTFTRTLARALVKEGHHVTVLGLYPAERVESFVDQGVRILRLAQFQTAFINPFLNAVLLSNAIRRVDRQTPLDVVDGPELSQAYFGGARWARKIIRMNGGHHFFYSTLGRRPRFWRGLWEHFSFSRADAICAVSNFVADTTRNLLKLGTANITILPNPVNTEQFRPRPEIPEMLGAIFFAGTVCEKKGIRQLVQAMPAIVAEVPSAHLWVAGRDTVDPQTGESFTAGLRSLIPNALQEKITFLGPVPNDNLPKWIARAQVCVFPSHMESQGIVTIEGMASGKVVVASKTGPGPELISSGVDGLLCDPYDPGSISEKTTLVLKNANLRKNLGKAARQKAETEFSVTVLVKKNLDFYESCLKKS